MSEGMWTAVIGGVATIIAAIITVWAIRKDPPVIPDTRVILNGGDPKLRGGTKQPRVEKKSRSPYRGAN